MIDYGALKQRTLGTGADDEAVTVNTRALIDKVLARYSGEWTVLRELLQNAADAGASKVTIKLETLPSSNIPLPQAPTASDLLKHVVTHHTVKRLLVTNNGQVFNENDWSRLKRIAEGNPDETKIGAFGVGFYSVFADCEEPFVSSGNEALAFYWKGNSLFTRRLQLLDADTAKETSFVLDYRNTTSPVPSLMQISQFLASSLTFVGIEELELWLDDHNILRLSKKTAPSSSVSISRDIETKTSEGLFRIRDVTTEMAQIDGDWMDIIGWRDPALGGNRLDSLRNNDPVTGLRTFFARMTGSSAAKEGQAREYAKAGSNAIEENLTGRSSTGVFLSISTATLETFTTQTFKEELERATKKPPPKTARLAILTSPYIAEAAEDVSRKATSASTGVFATVLPTKSGRVFIGFPTHQTTGLKAHISAPSVIPTVERESIDLNARWVRTWNFELLRAAGIACRVVWSSEMSRISDSIHRRLDASGRFKIRLDHVVPLLPDVINLAKTFSFQESTPSAQTGQIVEDAFWTCNKKATIEVMSTCGVLPNHQVRIAPKNLSFMDGIPTLPQQFVTEAKFLVDRLTDYGLVTEVTVADIKQALEHNALTIPQLYEFLFWLCDQARTRQLDRQDVADLLMVAVANEDSADGKSAQVLVLANKRHYLNPNKIPAELPQTSSTMPFVHTKRYSKMDLEAIGWEEAQVVPWLEWLIQNAGNRAVLTVDEDMTRSPKFASQVLPVLSKQWDSLSPALKSKVVEQLGAKTVIPTRHGMRKPAETYFPAVKVFDDLPIIHGLNSVKERFLVALGVRKTLELDVVFTRLLQEPSNAAGAAADEKSQWRHIGLIQYLASVRDDIPPADIQKLREKAICPKESPSDPRAPSSQKYRVSHLYEPQPVLRELGLPIVSWSGSLQTRSPEGKLLALLGLKTTPSAGELIDIMVRASNSDNGVLRDKAMSYFITNHHANGYGSFDYSRVAMPFLPLQNSSKLSVPNRCFTDDGAGLFGFEVLKHELQPHAAKFGVRPHPPMELCITKLVQQPPSTAKDARTVFAYFASRLSEINANNVPQLHEAKIVPIRPRGGAQIEKQAQIRHIAPKACFLGSSETFGEIFDYVDFGNEANAFLIRCGSKHEPTKTEIAQILVAEPARIYFTFRDPERYLDLLRNLGDSLKVLKKEKELFKAMKRSPFVLVSKTVVPSADSRQKRAKDDDDADSEEEGGHELREWQLTTAENAVIVDDYASYNIFKAGVLAAPQEEGLEDFYWNLGSPLLSSLVEESLTYGRRLADQEIAGKLYKQVCERSRLFLQDQPQDAIKHDGRWLEKNLQVVAISSIKLRKSLRGKNLQHVEQRSAAVTFPGRECTLWVSGSVMDYYQISQSLAHVILNRPKLHSALTLEMLLKTELKELGARGFNVSRILRQKAAEKRVVDQQRQIEDERRRIEEQERAWNASQTIRAEQQQSRETKVPGSFPADGAPAGLSTVGGGGGRAQLKPPTTEDIVTAPHRLQQNLLTAIQRSRPYNSSTLKSTGVTNEIAETRTYCDEKSAQNLRFVATGKHGINIFLASSVKDGNTSNNSIASAAATAVATSFSRFSSSSSSSSSSSPSSSTFVTQNATGLSHFATLLRDVASVFALDLSTINIFYDDNDYSGSQTSNTTTTTGGAGGGSSSGKRTIAFNRRGSIFCNYLYFQQLHQAAFVESQPNQPNQPHHPSSVRSSSTTTTTTTTTTVNIGGREPTKTTHYSKLRNDALLYWWVTLCHELAHNLVSDHSAEHSYYIEHFVVEYLRKVVAKMTPVVMEEKEKEEKEG